MKQITNMEFEEWQKYKAEKANGHILLPDTVRFICEANGYQYQKKEYTTSSQSTLDGWTLYDSSYTWGDYGPLGEWTDLGNGVVVEEGQKIERRTVYRYYYFLCNSCLSCSIVQQLKALEHTCCTICCRLHSYHTSIMLTCK